VSTEPSIPDPRPVSDYLADGARILAILLVWGVIAAAAGWAADDVFRVRELSSGLSGALAVTGLLNAVLFVCYRTVDYARRS
jgi:CHASE2 domain-containing sensor protein